MGFFKDYNQFINEEFGFSTVANTPGMGDAVAPTSTSTGSGDIWPSIGSGVWTGMGFVKARRKRKRKMRKK